MRRCAVCGQPLGRRWPWPLCWLRILCPPVLPVCRDYQACENRFELLTAHIDADKP